MGVVLGTLTTKDGLVIPLPEAADDIRLDDVEFERRKEEFKFSRRVHNVTSSTLWGRDVRPNGDVVIYDRYRTITEDLKRKGAPLCGAKRTGETMVKDIFGTKQFKLFRALFHNPHVALDTRKLAALSGVNPHSVSILMQRPMPFLISEGLVEVKGDPRGKRFKTYTFKANCDDAEAEAKLWYEKMLQNTSGSTKKPAAGVPVKSQPQAAAPKAIGPLAQVQVDTETMEAVIRVPLDKLALVLKAIS